MNTSDEIYFTFTCGGTQHAVFEHFIKHHLDMGIKKENIYFCYHRNIKIDNSHHIIWKNIFKKLKLIPCMTVASEWHSDIQLKTLKEIKKMIPINSWVVRTDTDCFIELPFEKNNIYDFCKNMIDNSSVYARAVVVDRLSLDGKLKEINDQNIFEQFPLILKDYGRLRQLYKLFNKIELDKTPKNCMDRPRESLIFLHKNFIEYSNSCHNIDWPTDPNIKLYDKMGLLHHFKWDKTSIKRHKKNKSNIGIHYNRPQISGVYETFCSNSDDCFDMEKIKYIFDKQIEPKSMINNPNFPSFAGQPAWI